VDCVTSDAREDDAAAARVDIAIAAAESAAALRAAADAAQRLSEVVDQHIRTLHPEEETR
jgi:hypothetical protein